VIRTFAREVDKPFHIIAGKGATLRHEGVIRSVLNVVLAVKRVR